MLAQMPVCPCRRPSVHYATAHRQNRTYMIMSKGAVDKRVPPGSKFIRAETKVSGYLIRPIDDGRSSSVYMVGATDLKGDLPKFLTEMVAPKTISDWFKRLAKAHRKLKSQDAMSAPQSRRHTHGPVI